MTEMEKHIERALVGVVKRHGGLCLKWVCPGWSGVPDRIILLPGGRVVFAEVKRPAGGKLAKIQKYWSRVIKDMGFSHWVIWDRKDLDLFELVELRREK